MVLTCAIPVSNHDVALTTCTLDSDARTATVPFALPEEQQLQSLHRLLCTPKCKKLRYWPVTGLRPAATMAMRHKNEY